MSRKVLTLGIILLLVLMVVPTAFAAPEDSVPAISPGASTDQDDVDDEGDDVDDEGDDVDTEDDDVDDEDDDVDDEDDDVDDEGDDVDTADDEDEDEDEDDDADDADEDEDADFGSLLQHPAARFIEKNWGVSADEVTDIFENGFGEYEGQVGLGRIMMAKKLEGQLTNLGWSWEELLAWHLGDNGGWGQLKVADKLSNNPEEAEALLAQRASGCGWGQIRKGECGEDGQVQGKGKDKDKDKGGPPDVPPGQAKKDK